MFTAVLFILITKKNINAFDRIVIYLYDGMLLNIKNNYLDSYKNMDKSQNTMLSERNQYHEYTIQLHSFNIWQY